MSLETHMAVNPFVGKGYGREPETISDVKLEKDPLVERALTAYRDVFKLVASSEGPMKRIYGLSDLDVLNPAQIDLLLQHVLSSGEKRLVHFVGSLANRLIQDSYDAGYNSFTLTTGNFAIHSIGHGLEGSSSRKLEVTVNGNMGSFCGFSSSYASFLIKGDTQGSCAQLSEFSSYFFDGDIGWSCGCHSRKSMFITSNWETYKKLKKTVPKIQPGVLFTGNKVKYTLK